MAIATGVAKELRIKREATWGTAPAAANYTALRRLTSSVDLNKATYKSNEIRTDYQRSDFRHGMRSVEGAISGELSCGTYSEFLAAVCRKDFAAGASEASVTGLTAAATTAGNGTITRASGSWLTNFKIGDVVRQTGWTTTGVNNNSKNLLITDLTATVMTVATLDGSAIAAKASETGAVSTSVQGKKTWVPTTGHQDISFSIEHWFANISQSELFTGCKVGQADINLPATGMAEANFAIQGKDVTTGTAAYYTGTATVSAGGVLAAVNGALYIGGTKVGNVTGMNFTINANISRQEVVGSNFSPDLFLGAVDVSGQMTALFENATLRDMFLNETEAALTFVLTAGNQATSDFLAITMPRIKIGGSSKDDGEKGLVQTIPFTALLNTAGGPTAASLATTISIQDSLA